MSVDAVHEVVQLVDVPSVSVGRLVKADPSIAGKLPSNIVASIFPLAFSLYTLSFALVALVSSFVTYLLLVLGVPLVPARASYLGLSVMRATGTHAGVTSVRIRPALLVVAFHGVVPVSWLSH